MSDGAGESSEDIYAAEFVKDVFDRCSDQYIKFSYICSFGFTERWRKQCVGLLPIATDKSSTIYDLMSGTGEIWPHLYRALPNIGSITAVDISTGMHNRAIERLHKHRDYAVTFIEDDVLASSLPDESADIIISTFGLKTFNEAQHERLADLIARLLRPGGTFAMIEASDPRGWILRPLYLFHLKRVLPIIEKLLLRGAQDFAMIGTYSTNFQNAASFGDMLRAKGLNVTYRKHFFGCATSVSGRKPD